MNGTRGKHEPERLRLRHIDGHYLWFDCTAENQIDNPNVRGLIIIARDVTDQKTAEDAQIEAEARFRAAFERSPLGIGLITLEGHILDVNDAFSTMTGRTEEELIGLNLELLVHPDDRERMLEEGAARLLGSSDKPPSPARLVQPDGRVVWMMSDLSLVTKPDGTPEYTIVLLADVTERIKLEERLEYQAFHDPLTQLANRARLHNLLEQAWERRAAPGELALLFVDLDRFKQVNDSLGHVAGDELLLLVARRLERERARRRRGRPLRRRRVRRDLREHHEPRRGAADRRPHPRESRPHLPLELRRGDDRRVRRHRDRRRAGIRRRPAARRRHGRVPSQGPGPEPGGARPSGRRADGERTGRLPQPVAGALEQVAAHHQAPIEGLARNLFAVADPQQRDPLVRDDAQARLRSVGHRRVRVDRRHLEREIRAADSPPAPWPGRAGPVPWGAAGAPR